MKRKLFLGALALVLLLLLAGCGCEHEWLAATCTAPKTCQLCGETEGEPLAHTWQEATCTMPKTCTVCSATEGEPAEHNWKNADCTAPKTCTVCNTVEGEKSAHTWQEATCTAPKTCSVCKTTEGKVADHKWTGATCTKAGVCSTCGKKGKTAAHKWTGATCTKAGVCSVCNATGKKVDHKYKVISDEKRFENFAAKRVKKCETCSKEKVEYRTQKSVFDLDAINAEIAEYAKKRGFQVSIGTGKEEDYRFSESVLLLDLTDRGQDYIIKGAKARVDMAYNDYASSPAGIGAYTLHIEAYYTESGSLGGGFLGVTLDITS